MRIGGILSQWNDERGFGFITPARGGPDVFVHISEFPRDGMRPQLGEKLTFEVETDGKGKERAVRLECPQRPNAGPARPSDSRMQASGGRKPGAFKWLALLVLVLLGLYGYSGQRQHAAPPAVAVSEPEMGESDVDEPERREPQLPRNDADAYAAGLPPEARKTLRLIGQGGPFPYERDGVVFGNYERRLPERPRGYYHEYTVKTPGERGRGARRIVCGPPPECYYSDDHYQTFQRIGP